MEKIKTSVFHTKTSAPMKPLFIIATSAGILCIILYNFYVITPQHVLTETTIASSSKLSPEADDLSNTMERGVRENLDESGLDLKHVLHDIFNITKEIEDIKERLKHYDKKLDTTSKYVSVENSKNVTLKSKYLLTIFSTWTESEDRLHIYNNTLRNWASFKPIFNPVLFTNDTTLAKNAQKYGWKVLPLTKVADNGLPILKYMYIAAINAFSSTFYCYANSDILFEDGLVKTLVNLEYALGAETLDSTPVFLTGLRWNVINVLGDEISPREKIKTLIAKRGAVFVTSAEDYFITNGIYPWQEIQDVVVGSVAYDNWLVANARKKKHFTINTSRTIPALHQSLDTNNHRSHVRDTANYNANLLKDVYKINLPYHKGFLDCIEKFTDFVNDTFVLGDRMVGQFCN